MNLMLVAWSPRGDINGEEATASFARYLRELPFRDFGPVQSWRAPSGRVTVCCASHRAAQTGGTTYAHFEPDRFAMYSGRPFVWAGDDEADGRGPLDPRFYLQSPKEWVEALDGRVVAVRYDDRSSTLDVYTDPLGASHFYSTCGEATRWLSNSAELLRQIARSRVIAPLALASVVGCGWSLGGQPFWQDVRRVPRGLSSFRPEGDTSRDVLPAQAIEAFFEGGFTAKDASRTLVRVVRALADWPGRPSVVSLTGGRDSRLVFAAALQAGVEFETRIIVGEGGPETQDARTARAICEAEGRELHVSRSRSLATVADAAHALRLCAPGTLTLDLAWSALNRPGGTGIRDGESEPLALVHSGHGGELARAYYGVGAEAPADVARGLYRQVTHVWPRPPLTKVGGRLIQESISGWVDAQVGGGVTSAHLPDLFYLLERMNSWVGGSHGFDEHMADLTSPLWTPRLLPYQFGLPTAARSRELFHYHVLDALDPQLTRLPFAGSNPAWPTFGAAPAQRGRHLRRLRRIAAQASRELRRRYHYRVGRGTSDPQTGLAAAAALARDEAPESTHEIWQVIDRKRALDLLAGDPVALDARSRRTAWRLATAVLVCRD